VIIATGATATDLKFPNSLAEHAKQLCEQHNVNESLVGTRDIAFAYVDRYAGSGVNLTAAIANLSRWRLPDP
jgi:hypothetical protein